MFEALLERLIASKLGRYLAGLDKKNFSVGLWKGDVVLENTEIKPDVLDFLRLPLKLVLGKIQRLVIRVPWRKLSSSPVEIEISGVYLLLRESEQSQWSYSEAAVVSSVKEKLESFEQAKAQQQAERQLLPEEVLRGKSFTERLSAKIIDNLRIRLRDIHIRFEMTAGRRVTPCGILLQSLDCYTTNERWTMEFLDRQTISTAGTSIYKLAELTGLSLYLQTSNLASYLTLPQAEEVFAQMQANIRQQSSLQFVIQPINIIAKVVHNADFSDFSRPQFSVELEMHKFEISYQQKQFQHTIEILEFFAEYRNFLFDFESKKKYRIFLPKERTAKSMWHFAISCVLSALNPQKSINTALLFWPWRRLLEWETAFKLHHWKVRHNQTLSDAEQSEYDKIIYAMDISTLYEWTSHVVAIVERESKDVQANKPGFFHLIWGKSEESQKAEDYEALIRDLSYKEEGDLLVPPADYTWLKVRFLMSVGELTLVKTKPGNLTEGVTISTKDTLIECQLENDSYSVELSILDTHGVAWEHSDSHEDSLRFYRRSARSEGKILQISHRSLSANSAFRSQTSITTAAVEIIYSPKVLERAVTFFMHIQAQQAVKAAARDKLQSLQMSTNQQISKVLRSPEKKIIEMDLSAPVLIVQASEKECFKLSLGRFQISNRVDNQSEMYEEVKVTVTDVKLVHEDPSTTYAILQPVAFSLRARFLNHSSRASKQMKQSTPLDRFPDVELSGRLENVQFSFTYHVYRLLLETVERLKAEGEALEALSMDKRSVMKSATAFDLVSKYGFKGWFTYFCVLSQDYLYFFNSPTETVASTYFHLKDCSVELATERDWSIYIRSQLGDCSIAFQSAEQLGKWQKLISHRISNSDSLISRVHKQVESLEVRRVLVQKAKTRIEIELEQISVSLTDDSLDSWFMLSMTEISLNALTNQFCSQLDAKLRKLEITDRRIESLEQFYTLAKSLDEEQGLIDFLLLSTSPQHPEYNGVETTCDVRFHHVALNWNQETLVDLLNFLTFQPSRPEMVKQITASKCSNSADALLRFNLHCDKIDLLLNNVQSEITIAKLSAQEFDMTLRSYSCRTEIEGNLGNIFLFDLTDYPRTAQRRYLENPVPFCLFSLREGLQQLLHFSVKSFKRGCKEIKGNVDVTLDFHLASVKFVYLHQPVIRIVDFFLSKILSLFDKQKRMKNWHMSVYATDYSRFIEKVIRETNEELLSYETFTSILVKVDNPLIILTPRPGYPHFITVDLGKITVANRHERSSLRHESEEAWVDVYRLSCQDMSITTQTSQITSYFDLQLDIERLIATERQSLTSGFDASYSVRGVCREILFDISQFEYMLLLKLFDMNILYDDHMEKFINSDCIVDGNRGSRFPFMRMDFQFERISVLIELETEPIAELVIYGNEISMVRFMDDFMTFHLASKNFELYAAASGEYSEVFPALRTEPGRLKTIIGRPINDPAQFTKPVFEVHLEKTWDSNKRILVTLEYIGLYMNLAVLLELQNFFYYGIPEYHRERETPLDYLTKYRPSPEDISGEAEDQWFAPKIEFSLEIRRPIIVFPTSPGARILVSEGDVLFEYYREHGKVLAENEGDFKESCKKDLRWKDLELFSIRSKDLAGASDLSNVKAKRKIIDPFTYEYKSILENKGRKPEKYYMTHGTSPVHCILSFNDLTDFKQSYLFQKSALDERWETIKVLELIQSPKLLDFQSVSEFSTKLTKTELMRHSLQLQRFRTSGLLDPTLNQSQKQALSIEEEQAVVFVSSEIYYNLPELRIIMINDCAGAYSPLLNAKCSLSRAINHKTERGEEMRVECDMKVKYYNPLADRWEPLVECLRATLLYRLNMDATPKSQFIISVSDDMPLNINLSEAMLVHLYKVVNIWKALDTDPQKELVELVSPFSICNEFGSLIIIETSGQLHRTQVIDPGVTLPYEVELSGCRDFTTSDERISLRLMLEDEEIECLQGISMRKVQSTTKAFSYNERLHKVVLDIAMVETRKVLTVRSPLVFVNETNESMFLYFPYRPRRLLGECLAGKSCPVPFLYCDSIIGMLPTSCGSSEPIPVDLKVLLASQNGHYVELSMVQSSFVLYVQRYKENTDKVTVRVLPPFRFRNLLPCAVMTTFSSQQARVEVAKAKVAKGETYDLHSFTTSQEVHMALRLKDLNESEEVVIAAKKDNLRAKSITLRDMEGNELELTLSYREEGCREISVYAAVSILNFTGLPLSFYYRKRGGSRKIPIQDPGEAILCPSCSKLVTELNMQRSESFKIGAVGAHNVVTVKGEKDENDDFTVFQFVYDVEVAWPKADELLYTRVVSISPRLIIVNMLKCYLVVIQEGIHKDPLILQPGDRSPFYWTTGRHKEFVQIRPVPTSVHYKHITRETEMQWDWSGPIAITNMGTTIVQCKDREAVCEYALIKAEVRLVEFSALAIFEEEEERFSSYRVENRSAAVSLGIYQVDCEEHRRYVDMMSSMAFGWTNPLKAHHIVVEFYIGTLASCPVMHCKYLFDFEQLNRPQFAKIKRSAELGHILFLLVHNVGPTIVLEVSDSPLESFDSSSDLAQSIVNVNIPHMGFSLIESKWPLVKELIYAHITGIDGYYVKTATLTKMSLTVQTLQVDNQYNLAPIYPVMIFQNSDSTGTEVFRAVVSQYIDENPTVKSFKEAGVALQSLCVNMESIMVRKLVGFYLRAMKELASAQPEGVHVIFQPFTSDKLKSPMWLTQELSRSHVKYYIEKLNLNPVKIVLSYATLNEEQEQSADEELLAILSARGMLVMNVDSVPLRFYSFDVENVNANQKQIMQALALHYKSQFKSELFKLIGYTDILGNPIGLFNNLGTGFIDLLYEPVQGMAQGPLEAGKGLVKGAGSFLKNSVSATFGTLSKLTGSVATGITALTQGKEAMLQRQRDKAAHTPKDVVEGIAYGVKSLALGFGRGMTGVVTEPYKGARSEGFPGLIKGSLRGVSGLIVRPVAGVFDFTSKTAEGIKNTTHRFESRLGMQRVRPPRVTYGLSHHIRPYNENDAEVVQFMNDLSPQRFRSLTFYYQVISQDWEGGQVLFVLYQELFVAVYILTRKVIWEVERMLVEDAEATDVRCGVVITKRIAGKAKSSKRLQFLASFPSPSQQAKFLRKLRKVYFPRIAF